MTNHSETDINLKTLQRVDKNINEIIDNASQVAVYKYDSTLEKWEGTDIEGTLFLYRRSSSVPRHGFIIVNRMNTTNFVESITSDMQFQLQEPYLLYKNHSGDIIGCWFYECKDLKRISKKIQRMVLGQCTTPRRQRCASESESVGKDGSPNIMTLLSEAHKEFMRKGSRFHLPSASTAEKAENQPPITLTAPAASHMTSPRRRFLSTGSCKEKTSSQSVKEQTSNSCESKWEIPKPLSIHREVVWSPLSDVELLGSSPAKDCDLHKATECVPQLIGYPDCDTHVSAMKQSLTFQIQDNPKMLLKIHEAYVSSLRSLFVRD